MGEEYRHLGQRDSGTVKGVGPGGVDRAVVGQVIGDSPADVGTLQVITEPSQIGAGREEVDVGIDRVTAVYPILEPARDLFAPIVTYEGSTIVCQVGIHKIDINGNDRASGGTYLDKIEGRVWLLYGTAREDKQADGEEEKSGAAHGTVLYTAGGLE